MAGHNKVYFATHENVSRISNDIARSIGLDNASEYMRIAMEFLVANRRMPEEFKGMRSPIRMGRPLKDRAATHAREEGA